jgi:tetratricopeptide (TPR) repeat protein
VPEPDPDDIADLALSQQSEGHFDEALATYARLVAADPENPEVYNLRAGSYIGKSDWLNALADFEKAIELDPGDPTYHINRAGALRQLNRFDESAKALRDALRLEPNDPELHQNIGILRLEMNQVGKAIAAFSKAILMADDFSWAYFHRAIAYRLKGDNAKAIADLDEVIRLEPGFKQAHDLRKQIISYR